RTIEKKKEKKKRQEKEQHEKKGKKKKGKKKPLSRKETKIRTPSTTPNLVHRYKNGITPSANPTHSNRHYPTARFVM
ncbi:hypothetical protein LTR03_014398, partial [Friedmanniomyces endolithicus]